MENLKSEVTKIKKKLRLLNHGANGSNASGSGTQIESAEAEPIAISKEKHYNGHTISDIKSFIRSTDSIAKVVDSVLKKLFTTDEILNCSITGKRSTKSSDEGPRPALDQERFDVFMDIILSSCEASRKEIVEKVQNVMKTTRKKHKTSQQ